MVSIVRQAARISRGSMVKIHNLFFAAHFLVRSLTRVTLVHYRLKYRHVFLVQRPSHWTLIVNYCFLCYQCPDHLPPSRLYHRPIERMRYPGQTFPRRVLPHSRTKYSSTSPFGGNCMCGTLSRNHILNW